MKSVFNGLFPMEPDYAAGTRRPSGLFYSFRIDRVLECAIKRRRPEPHLAAGTFEDFLHDSVAVLVRESLEKIISRARLARSSLAPVGAITASRIWGRQMHLG